jgi:hypothetical protein
MNLKQFSQAFDRSEEAIHIKDSQKLDPKLSMQTCQKLLLKVEVVIKD